MNVGTNKGDARAFKLDTLLKLVDIKGKDGKTTLLHFVVQEIARVEGSELTKDNNGINNQSSLEIDVESRKLGLQVVSGLSGELTNVKKAATMDSCVLSNEVAKLAGGLARVNEVIQMCCDETFDHGQPSKFAESMKRFVARAEQEIVSVQAEESSTLSLVRELTEYFHGDSAKEEAHPFRIFLIVKDFLAILDMVCKEVGRINERSIYGSAVQFSAPAITSVPPPFFTEFNDRRDFAASRADGYDGR
ncbi:hypothetical protein MLD38_035695 [Melastoma candidum]|nr:hypothetical protein MLD38_035695 [Melastoma candidum]